MKEHYGRSKFEIMWGKISLIVLAGSSIYILLQFLQYLNSISYHVNLANICTDEELILKIQKEQLLKGRLEILLDHENNDHLIRPSSSSSPSSSYQGDDTDFYRATFGHSEVKIFSKQKEKQTKQTKKKTTTTAMTANIRVLVYHHLWKNANTNIRSLLLQYAYQSTNDMRSYKTQKCYLENSKCVHANLHTFAIGTIRHFYPSNPTQRYAFTFTRDPFTRFLSAMNEIEYRAWKKNLTAFPSFHSKVGTQERIQEFIKLILLYGGSKNLLRDFKQYEILHIAPMIGTYVISHKVEGKPLHLYKIEEFSKDWQRLSNDTNVPMLNEIYSERNEKDWEKHNSSSDPLDVLLAAKSFFHFGSADINQRLKRLNSSSNVLQKIPPGYGYTDYQQLAVSYIRAICRIYLLDFQCFNYALPAECEDLNQEFTSLAHEYLSVRHRKDMTDHLLGFTRHFVPKNILQRIAEVICMFNSSPDCEANLVHGEPIEFKERHDEL